MGTGSLERQSTEATSELFVGSTGTAQDVVHATKSGAPTRNTAQTIG